VWLSGHLHFKRHLPVKRNASSVNLQRSPARVVLLFLALGGHRGIEPCTAVVPIAGVGCESSGR